MSKSNRKPSTGPTLFQSEPHGEHTVSLIEDANAVDNRIYAIVQRDHKAAVFFTGAELASVADWWATEEKRKR
jgi:hypothetical protein